MGNQNLKPGEEPENIVQELGRTGHHTMHNTHGSLHVSHIFRQPRILCLHGWRTSGSILKMQTAAFRHHTKVDCEFITAPFPSQGDPDAGISQFYPDYEYFEWHNGGPQDIEKSEQMILEVLKKGNFDAILGFSQGAAMCTRVMKLLEDTGLSSVKAVILIGGVPPHDWSLKAQIVSEGALPESADETAIDICIKTPSLHIHGLSDPHLLRSQQLQRFYDPVTTTLLQHEEDHRIPSIRTGLYPHAKKWIYEQSACVEA